MIDWTYISEWWRPVVEITILTIAIYYILIFVRGTRGWPVVIGFVVMLGLSFVSDLLKLQVLALFFANLLCGVPFCPPGHFSTRIASHAGGVGKSSVVQHCPRAA